MLVISFRKKKSPLRPPPRTGIRPLPADVTRNALDRDGSLVPHSTNLWFFLKKIHVIERAVCTKNNSPFFTCHSFFRKLCGNQEFVTHDAAGSNKTIQSSDLLRRVEGFFLDDDATTASLFPFSFDLAIPFFSVAASGKFSCLSRQMLNFECADSWFP